LPRIVAGCTAATLVLKNAYRIPLFRGVLEEQPRKAAQT
jgi:hypothetical protein